ncbi:MAG: hypothetical protein MI923_01270 [Phycisphaerales bacterium]|nr:hypothetical protein [Phycisphaerales bacterium]
MSVTKDISAILGDAPKTRIPQFIRYSENVNPASEGPGATVRKAPASPACPGFHSASRRNVARPVA